MHIDKIHSPLQLKIKKKYKTMNVKQLQLKHDVNILHTKALIQNNVFPSQSIKNYVKT